MTASQASASSTSLLCSLQDLSAHKSVSQETQGTWEHGGVKVSVPERENSLRLPAVDCGGV